MLSDYHKMALALTILPSYVAGGKGFLKSIVNGDVIWIQFVTPETKPQ